MNQYRIRVIRHFQSDIGVRFVIQTQYNCWPPDLWTAHKTKQEAREEARKMAKEYRAEGAEVIGWL